MKNSPLFTLSEILLCTLIFLLIDLHNQPGFLIVAHSWPPFDLQSWESDPFADAQREASGSRKM